MVVRRFLVTSGSLKDDFEVFDPVVASSSSSSVRLVRSRNETKRNGTKRAQNGRDKWDDRGGSGGIETIVPTLRKYGLLFFFPRNSSPFELSTHVGFGFLAHSVAVSYIISMHTDSYVFFLDSTTLNSIPA